ncbi:hypothetical protein Trydic_g2548 [Trypoxylus dichotomus]
MVCTVKFSIRQWLSGHHHSPSPPLPVPSPSLFENQRERVPEGNIIFTNTQPTSHPSEVVENRTEIGFVSRLKNDDEVKLYNNRSWPSTMIRTERRVEGKGRIYFSGVISPEFATLVENVVRKQLAGRSLLREAYDAGLDIDIINHRGLTTGV